MNNGLTKKQHMIFKNRIEAAQLLAEKLMHYKQAEKTVIQALPRGGVITGDVLSKQLRLPLDICMVKKIGHPDNPEMAIGSVTLNGHFIDRQDIDHEEYIRLEVKRLKELLIGQYKHYKGNDLPADIANKTVIITDDGVATGSTILGAVKSAQKQKVKKIIVAVPVAPPSVVRKLEQQADEVICLHATEDFSGVSQFYKVFEQVEDVNVREILTRAIA